MGRQRLPRDPEEQRRWARRLVAGLNIPPIDIFLQHGESPRQAYQRIFRRAFEIGAEAALNECLAELERSDDPYVGLPPHLVKSAKAAARARDRKRLEQANQIPANSDEIETGAAQT